MNSLMFTFSADQMSIQLESGSKYRQSQIRSIRKRPTSYHPSDTSKSRILSSNSNQLFENSNFKNQPMEGSPQKSINTIKIKSTSIQMNQKKKLRNIIDNMLSKNFENSTYNKMNSITIPSRKHSNKNRSLIGNTLNNQKKYQFQENTESKQNELNLQNIDVKSIKQISTLQNQHKKRPNIKIKKYQFANLKFNKMNQYSQRYDQSLNQSQQILKVDKNIINLSHESIEKESLNKKISRSKTPKIMYPQSDTKLPSVFRTKNPRSSCGNSLGKRKTRISSAQFLSEDNDKKTEQSVYHKENNSISEQRMLDPLIKTKTRPLSMMNQTRKNSILMHKKQNQNQLIYPRKLIFQNQSIQESINKKLMQNNSTCQDKNINLNIRIASRAKSTHINHAHRKLRELNSYLNNEPLKKQEYQKNKVLNNESQHSKNSKQTFEQSTLHSSTDKTLICLSGRTQKLNEEIACSMTFNIQKCKV